MLGFNSADDVRHELTRLRDRVDSLGSRLQPRLNAAAEEAGMLGQFAQRQLSREASRVSGAVQEQPLVALGLALVTGFVLASLIRR